MGRPPQGHGPQDLDLVAVRVGAPGASRPVLPRLQARRRPCGGHRRSPRASSRSARPSHGGRAARCRWPTASSPSSTACPAGRSSPASTTPCSAARCSARRSGARGCSSAQGLRRGGRPWADPRPRSAAHVRDAHGCVGRAHADAAGVARAPRLPHDAHRRQLRPERPRARDGPARVLAPEPSALSPLARPAVMPPADDLAAQPRRCSASHRSRSTRTNRRCRPTPIDGNGVFCRRA